MDIFQVFNIFNIIVTTLLGIVIGSFLNVIIYRIPEGRTVVKGHSMCMSCGHELNALDLVPVFSWLFLGGKCRYCKAPVSSRYIKIETFTGLSFFLFALTHREFQLNPLNPTDITGLILFAHLCLCLACICGLISTMMIYHDTSKSYYGFSILLLASAIVLFILETVAFIPSFIIESLVYFFIIAIGSIVVLWVFCKLLRKKYTLVDLWLDLPFALFYAFFGIFLIERDFVIPSLVITFILPRFILKGTKYDKISAIVPMCGILLVIVVGYILNFL